MDNNGGQQHHHGKLQVSRTTAAVFCVCFAFVIMAIFHLIYVGWCKNSSRTRNHNNNNNPTETPIPTHHQDRRRREETAPSAVTDNDDVSSTRLNLIVTMKYSKERKEEECVVCLSQFVQEDDVRVLVQCGHVFHVSCIDTWLRSHSTCPLCRVNTVAGIR